MPYSILQRRTFPLLIMAALLSAASCSKEKRNQSPVSAPAVKNSSGLTPSGIVTIQNTPLYQFNSDSRRGAPQWAAALDFGETVELDGPYNPNSYDTIDEESINLIPVRRPASADGGPELRGWMNRNHYASEDSRIAAVMASEIVLESGSGSVTITRGYPVVVYPDTADGSAVNIYSVEFASSFDKKPVKKTDLSFNPDDVGVAVSVARAAGQRNADKARAILEEAEKQYPASALVPVIRRRLEPQQDAPAERSLEPLMGIFSVGNMAAAVYEQPEKTAAILGYIEEFEDVTVTARTKTAEQADSGSVRWYYSTHPLEGWIFGTDLEGAD
ncbi:hypothetical protein [Breznakiella homolactica]|uniref:Uncharacterized protein n=1 Tax=Breznakiella homolactica TaxID=2798577 RepID=A0A7T7XN82_9SPIR|nr:hypothetical protein [Breznakiella homolactica]QQO09358.1 hypothetical protein JFL75_00090 [Breznakiella homolactica]